MLGVLKGFSLFISLERGLMLFMIGSAAAILVAGSLDLWSAVYLGLIAFCLWSSSDAINNIFDVELDRESDPLRAEFTERLGRWGILIFLLFSGLSLTLGLATGIPLISILILLGILIGILYSVPPFRFRQTIYKPVVNISVGAIPVIISSAFYNTLILETFALALLIGVTTSVNSLWEDLADYASDFKSQAKTILVVLGFKKGIYITIILGYLLVPLMIIVGLMFNLNPIYYTILTGLVVFITLRIIQKRSTLFGENLKQMLELGPILAKDFVIAAIIHTMNLMINGYLKHVFPL